MKGKTKNTALSEQLQNLMENSRNIDKFDTTNTYIHDRSFSWLVTGTSIKKSGGVDQTSPLCEMR